MEKIRAIIVDDEPLARKTIRLLLAQDGDVEIVGECRNGGEAISQIRTKDPDLVYLDVQMPGKTGFDVLRALDHATMPVIVFVTAYDQYALRAFEEEALDYLLKPFDDARFYRTLKRAKKMLRHEDADEQARRISSLLGEKAQSAKSPKSRYVSRILVKSSGRVFFLKTDDIDWVDAADYYAEFHVGKKSHLLRESMKSLETKLDPSKFYRIHRSTIVNLDRVKELQPRRGGESLVLLHDGTSLTLSRNRRREFERRHTLGA